VGLPLRLGDLQERRRFDDAGVADRDIERIDRPEHRVDRGAVGHVGLRVTAPTDTSDRRDPLRRFVLANAVDHRDVRAQAGELQRHRVAEVAGGAGDRDAESVELC
jgi:hypothetical protein